MSKANDEAIQKKGKANAENWIASLTLAMTACFGCFTLADSQ
jgi:hypothetical protein